MQMQYVDYQRFASCHRLQGNTNISAHRKAADMVNQKKAGARLAKKLGANIAALRKAQKKSQEQLAERLGVATETISRFERGATLPSLVTLQRLGQLLRVPITELLTDTSTVPDDQAAALSAWISELREEDREYVLAAVKRACDHFRGRR
jgi:transcriptional regulator with XRE-family HTH domain